MFFYLLVVVNKSKMKPNVLENISSNYCSMYNCWEIEKELAEIIRKTNARKYCIFKELVMHFGRVIEEGDGFFKGELGRETHYKLVKDTDTELLCKACSSTKYPGSDDIWLTFVCFS